MKLLLLRQKIRISLLVRIFVSYIQFKKKQGRRKRDVSFKTLKFYLASKKNAEKKCMD